MTLFRMPMGPGPLWTQGARPLLIWLLVAAAPALADAPAPLTLADCYRLALKQSETLAIHQELITEAEAHFDQALSGLLPRLSFVSSDKRQDGTGSTAFTLRHVPERKFTLSQPLFAGFKEFAAMRGAKAERAQRQLETAHAEQLLLVDVANAFYLLLELQDDLGALAMIQEALTARLDDLTAREQIGRSRASEVVSAKAALRRVEAEGHEVRRQHIVARHLMEFLTGIEPLGALVDAEPALPTVQPESAYLAKAVGQPAVQATEQAARVAKEAVTVAGADRWPTVDLDGNYYVERVGNAKDVAWDATLEVD
ncbi:MAG: TolC family protein, partial [Candidatus Omnitrophica bacterium]|nr:TolC family protein [Candidatus Omnitrophota bacterium]